MYEKLSYAQICIHNSQLKGLGGHLKQEAKFPLTQTTTQITMVRCNSKQQEDHLH